MTQQTKTTLISGALVAPLFAVFLFEVMISDPALKLEAVLFGFLAVKVILFLAAIAFVVQGFRVHWGWGLANLLLFPIAGIALFITHRREAMLPALVFSFGVALLVISLICAST